MPVRNRRPDNKDSYKVMIENLLRNVKRPHAGSRFGWVNVEYEYKPQGRALVDAGLITSAREYAIPPHYYNDPFTMKKELRGIALGWGHDIDDVAAHPYAKLAIVPAGRDITKLYLSNRDQIMKAQGDKWFPHLSNIKERRDKVKKLYNAMNNDGFYGKWRQDQGAVDVPMDDLNVGPLASNNGTFVFKEYVAEMKNGTEWLADKLEASIGFVSFIEQYFNDNRPDKRKEGAAEKSLKSFVLSEAESISRDAKVEWCAQNGHACCSLQHDGIVVALKEGTDVGEVKRQLKAVSSAALGYEQPCEVKPHELPEGVDPTRQLLSKRS